MANILREAQKMVIPPNVLNRCGTKPKAGNVFNRKAVKCISQVKQAAKIFWIVISDLFSNILMPSILTEASAILTDHGWPSLDTVTQIRGAATGGHRCSLGRGWYLDSCESTPSLPDFISLWLAGRRSDHWDQWGKHKGHDARQSNRADQIRRKTSEAVAEAGNRTSPRVRCVPHFPSPVFCSSCVLQTCRRWVF